MFNCLSYAFEQNNEESVEDGTTSKNVKLPHSEPASSPSGPLITSHHKTYQLVGIFYSFEVLNNRVA